MTLNLRSLSNITVFWNALLALCIGALTIGSTCHASVQGANQNPALYNEISGILLAENLAANAQPFFKDFSNAWLNYPESEMGVVRVRQQRSARYGQQIQVLFNDTLVFQASLSFQIKDFSASAQAATQQLARHIQRVQRTGYATTDPDLAANEF